jgi:ubiquinone/menaquinone biosynthesis C-methylase UbiE
VERIVRFHVPPGSSVLEIGCGTGDLLAALTTSKGVGIDISPKVVEIARSKHLGLTFLAGDAEDLPLSEPFDYVILSDLIGDIDDVQRSFEQLNKVYPRTRVIITYNHSGSRFCGSGASGDGRPQPTRTGLP